MSEALLRQRIVLAGIRNLNEFGYPGVNHENIITDMVYGAFFKRMLEDNKGKGADVAIDALIAEIDAAQPKDEPKTKKSRKRS